MVDVISQDGDVVRYFPTHGDIIHVPDPEMHLVHLLHIVQNIVHSLLPLTISLTSGLHG